MYMYQRCTVTVLAVLYLLPLCLHASTNITLLVKIEKDSPTHALIAAVESTIDIINNNNDTLPQYLLQYTTDKQVEPHILWYTLIVPVIMVTIIQQQ